MAGKLCISVIEARGVQADYAAELCFYVKLRLGPSEVRTDISRNSESPKFLKDVRMNVPNPSSDILRIELLQVGTRGDLVVGKDEIQVVALTTKGTVVHWFQLKALDRTVSAELCLVLRYLSAEASRPMSPSYAILTRQAKEKALDPLAPSPEANMQQKLPVSAFYDSPTISAKLPAAAAAPAAPADAASEAVHEEMEHIGHHNEDIEGETETDIDAEDGDYAMKGASSRAHLKGGSKARTVPLPLAILGGVLIGVAVHLWQKRPMYYVVQEGDTLCSQGGCFSITQRDKNSRKEDPDGVYAGDKLRIR